LFEGLLKTAIKAAVDGGNILVQNYGKISKYAQKESFRDIVTEIDKLSEKEIVKTIQAHDGQQHGILTEEQGNFGEKTNSYWVVDALDGTVNYFHQVPFFAVSIAYIQNNQPVVGVIFNPMAEDLYYCAEGIGSFKNKLKLTVSDKPLNSVITAGAFSGKAYNSKERQSEFELFGKINDLSQGCLRTGSAAINLAYVSEGKFGACWGKANKYWDIAAGLLSAKLAGAEVKFKIIDYNKHLVNYLAATPKCWLQLNSIVSEAIQLDS